MDRFKNISRLLLTSLRDGVVTIEEAFGVIDRLVDRDIELAEVLVNDLREYTNLMESVPLKYILCRINEIKEDNEFTDKEKEVIDDYIERGKSALKKYDKAEALDIFEEAYAYTRRPIFLYYIGKTLHKQKNYVKANVYFRHYLESGSTNYVKANLYLFGIGVFNSNGKECGYRLAILYHLPRICFSAETDPSNHADRLTRRTTPDIYQIMPSEFKLNYKGVKYLESDSYIVDEKGVKEFQKIMAISES